MTERMIFTFALFALWVSAIFVFDGNFTLLWAVVSGAGFGVVGRMIGLRRD